MKQSEYRTDSDRESPAKRFLPLSHKLSSHKNKTERDQCFSGFYRRGDDLQGSQCQRDRMGERKPRHGEYDSFERQREPDNTNEK